MKTKHVVVHLRLGYDYHGELSGRILDYLREKHPEDVIFLSDQTEYGNREKYSREYGFPQDCFYPSYDGHFDGISLPHSYFKDSKVEVMGYLYSPSGVHRCVNNAASDLVWRASKVEILEKLVQIREP